MNEGNWPDPSRPGEPLDVTKYWPHAIKCSDGRTRWCIWEPQRERTGRCWRYIDLFKQGDLTLSVSDAASTATYLGKAEWPEG